MEVNHLNKLLEAMARLADMEGMKAENERRKLFGQAIAYNENNFYYIADKIRELKGNTDE